MERSWVRVVRRAIEHHQLGLGEGGVLSNLFSVLADVDSDQSLGFANTLTG